MSTRARYPRPSRSRSRARLELCAAGLIAAALSVSGCGTAGRYLYEPAERATALLSGAPAAYYPVPETTPHGNVRVASFGITPVGIRTQADKPEIEALHARLVITNNQDDEPWAIDTRQQYVVIGDSNRESAVFVRADTPGAPPSPNTARHRHHLGPLLSAAAKTDRRGQGPRLQSPVANEDERRHRHGAYALRASQRRFCTDARGGLLCRHGFWLRCKHGQPLRPLLGLRGVPRHRHPRTVHARISPAVNAPLKTRARPPAGPAGA